MFWQMIDRKHRNFHFPTFMCIEEVLNIAIFSKYFDYSMSVLPSVKCMVEESEIIISNVLHGMWKHPSSDPPPHPSAPTRFVPDIVCFSFTHLFIGGLSFFFLLRMPASYSFPYRLLSSHGQRTSSSV